MRAIHTEPEEAVISKALRGLGCEAPTGTGLFPAHLCRGKSCLGPRKAGNRTYVTDGTKQGANSLLYSSASSSTRMRLDSETTDWCRPTSVAGELTTIRARKMVNKLVKNGRSAGRSAR